MASRKNSSYDKALYRLLSTISLLLKDERPTVKSLAVEFNVTERTIQKDIYERLIQFDIEKDKTSHLKFSDNFSISCIDKMIITC